MTSRVIGLEELLRQLIREEVRAVLGETLGDATGASVDDSELHQLAAERVAALKRARRTRGE